MRVKNTAFANVQATATAMMEATIKAFATEHPENVVLRTATATRSAHAGEVALKQITPVTAVPPRCAAMSPAVLQAFAARETTLWRTNPVTESVSVRRRPASTHAKLMRIVMTRSPVQRTHVPPANVPTIASSPAHLATQVVPLSTRL